MLTPDLSRPITSLSHASSRPLIGSNACSLPGASFGYIVRGAQTSVANTTLAPVKPFAATPIIVKVCPFSLSVLPNRVGSALNRRRHRLWLITTTGCSPTVRSSAGAKARPNESCVPRPEKKLAETTAAETASAWPSIFKLTITRWQAASHGEFEYRRPRSEEHTSELQSRE